MKIHSMQGEKGKSRELKRIEREKREREEKGKGKELKKREREREKRERREEKSKTSGRDREEKSEDKATSNTFPVLVLVSTQMGYEEFEWLSAVISKLSSTRYGTRVNLISAEYGKRRLEALPPPHIINS